MNFKSPSLAMICSCLLMGACANMPDMKTARNAAAEQDYTTAAHHYQALSDFGLPEAKMELGRLYLAGNGVPQDSGKALRLFQEAQTISANSRIANYVTQAQVKLGSDALKSTNTGLSPQAGIQLLTAAAEKNDPKALFELGSAYEKGTGVQADGVKAARYYERAAAMNYPRAYVQLGRLYAKGIGVGQNSAVAEQYFIKAREKGINVDSDLIRLQKKAG